MPNSAPTAGEVKDCPLDPYAIVHDKCSFVDQQTIKLQEAPDMVPVGELPRHLILSADRYVRRRVRKVKGGASTADARRAHRYLTGKVVPGSRLIATGVYSTFQSGKSRVSRHSCNALLLSSATDFPPSCVSARHARRPSHSLPARARPRSRPRRRRWLWSAQLYCRGGGRV